MSFLFKYKCYIFALLVCPGFAFAMPSEQCKFHPFIKNGFNIQDYKRCATRIHQCPVKGILPDNACVQKVIAEHPYCAQLAKISHVIGSDPSVVSAKEVGSGFVIIDQAFLADGQNTYYLISPKGCLIKTNRDPRDFSTALKKQYPDTDFIIVNWGEPKLLHQADGDKQSFMTVLKITKGCLACELIGYAKIHFDFTTQGDLIKISVQKIEDE